jgi:chaperonin cofactor prefoldin
MNRSTRLREQEDNKDIMAEIKDVFLRQKIDIFPDDCCHTVERINKTIHRLELQKENIQKQIDDYKKLLERVNKGETIVDETMRDSSY